AIDLDDAARHLADRRASGGEVGPCMARLAGRFQVEARDRITASDDAVIGAAGLGHQHIFVARGFRLDEVAYRGRADLLAGGEQHGDRQWRGESGARQLPDRFERQIAAALHVVDARSPALVAVATERQLLQRADRMNSIEMPRDENAGLALFRMRKTGTHTT